MRPLYGGSAAQHNRAPAWSRENVSENCRLEASRICDHPLSPQQPSWSRSMRIVSALAVAGAAVGLAAACRRPDHQGTDRKTTKRAIKVETVAKGLVHPWGTGLPARRPAARHRAARAHADRRQGRQTVRAAAGRAAVYASGQGGLLDVVLSPDFASSGLIYFSYAEPRGGGSNGTTVARAKARRCRATAAGSTMSRSFSARSRPTLEQHFGSRIVFMPDGSLFITLGERYSARDQAQNPANHWQAGARAAGRPPASRQSEARQAGVPEIWSIGHRNVQGAALNPASGRLWTIEHGARGGDEINIPQSGKNYGWPVITYGRDYACAKIGEGTAKPGMEQPIYYWDPSIAPSGAAFYTGDLFPEWKGNLFVGALAGQALHRLVLDGEKIVGEEALLDGPARAHPRRAPGPGRRHLAADRRSARPRAARGAGPRLARFLQVHTKAPRAPSGTGACRTWAAMWGRRRAPAFRLGPFLLTFRVVRRVSGPFRRPVNTSRRPAHGSAIRPRIGRQGGQRPPARSARGRDWSFRGFTSRGRRTRFDVSKSVRSPFRRPRQADAARRR